MKMGGSKMKKVLIIVTIIAILVGMTGCNVVRSQFQTNPNGQSLATATPASVTTTTVAVPVSNPVDTDTVVARSDNDGKVATTTTTKVEVSKEEMWSDLVSYAEKFLTGEWDGSEVYRPDYREGKNAYARVDENGWLRVGSNWPVIPGATIASSAISQIVSFGGWAEGQYAWSEDYSVEYVLSPTGRIGASGIAPWNKDYFVYQLTVVDAEAYHGELDYALLREMLIDGTWDGGRLWFPESGEIIQTEMLQYGIPCGVDHCYRQFLALDEPILRGMGYCDPETRLTVAITEAGIGLYGLDGSLVDLIDMNCDEREAFVAETSTGTCFVYDGRRNVYVVDFSDSEPTIKLAYQDVEPWYNKGDRVGFRGVDSLGMEFYILVWGDYYTVLG